MPSNLLNTADPINGLQTRRLKSVLSVNPPTDKPDGFVAAALVEIDKEAGKHKAAEVIERLETLGLSEDVAKATAKLNAGGLDRTQRLLLSISSVYASVLDLALTSRDGGAGAGPDRPRVDFKDTASLVAFIVRTLNTGEGEVRGMRERYAEKLVVAVREARGLKEDEGLEKRIAGDVAGRELPTASAKVEELIGGLFDRRRDIGRVEDAVKNFAEKTDEIDRVRLKDPRIQQRMIAFLKDLGVNFPKDAGSGRGGKFDEYFALAYNQAIRAGDGATVDPIDAVRTRGALTDWDFTVDTFETVEEQGVVPQNILAAGALDYVYNLGERLGMFKLADALVLRWASGAFDAEPGQASADLYRYWKLRSERISPEERAMMYRRILATGDGRLLSGMVENEELPKLWGQLMEKATDFIRRSEDASTDRPVSRQPIYQATKQLQFNLTEYVTGMAHMQITEMYHHLIEAKTVLEHAIDYFSTGSRKSLWTVIERASREWFEEAPNISAIRSAAVDGNKVFQWIASFDQSNVTDDQFQTFLDAAEAWILAQASDSSAPALGGEEGGEDPEEDADKLIDRIGAETEIDDWDK
jgi:hypothetical protein